MSLDNKNNGEKNSPLKPLPKRAAPKKNGNGIIASLSNMPQKKYFAVIGITLAVLLTVFFIAMQFGFSVYNKNNKPVPTPLPSEEPEITSDMLVPVDKATGIINILLLGVDVEGYRTDTMIVASYDLDKNNINLLSIPRDTRMYIGKKYQKINAAHAISQSGSIKGPQGAIEAVTRLTGIPINYYVEYSFSAFRNTIDSLGGVYFDVPQDMNYDDPVQNLHIHLKKGYQLLDGDKAEQLVRFRHYPMGDIARVEMQQKFLSALLEQKLKPETIKNIPALFEQWKNDISTNLSLLDITKLIPNILDLKTENIAMYVVPGNYNDTDYGASYWIADMKKLKTLINETFGYDASNITIHSADGSSTSKDVKKSSSTTKPASSQKTSAPQTPAPQTSKPTLGQTEKLTQSAPISTPRYVVSEQKNETTITAPPKATTAVQHISTPAPQNNKTEIDKNIFANKTTANEANASNSSKNSLDKTTENTAENKTTIINKEHKDTVLDPKKDTTSENTSVNQEHIKIDLN